VLINPPTRPAGHLVVAGFRGQQLPSGRTCKAQFSGTQVEQGSA
jgi:hypothetical protein